MSGALTHSPADVIRSLLVERGLGTEPSANGAWPAFCAQEPDSPDNCLTCYDTTGVAHSRHMPDGEVAEHHGVQVRVRSATHAAGFAMVNAVDRSLTTGTYPDAVTVSGSAYCVRNVTRTGTVISLGTTTPDSERHVFVVNYLVHAAADG